MVASVSQLEISVGAGLSGTLIALSGESDLTTTAELSEALAAQMTGGPRHMTVDLSGLSFADTATIRILLSTHRTLGAIGGNLELMNPHPNVARSLTLLGVDKILSIRSAAQARCTDG